MTPRENSNPILASWRAVLARRMRDAAILSAEGRVARTFAEIEAEARGFGCAFEKLPPGAVVGVQFGNDARFPALMLALWRRGLVPVPLDRSLARDAVAAALGMCGAAAIVRPNLSEGIAVERRNGGRKVDADFLKLTSGTTGAPRAIRFRAGQLLADCDAVCDTMGIGADDLNFGVIPWSHSYGFSNLVTPLIGRGVPVVAGDEVVPEGCVGDAMRGVRLVHDAESGRVEVHGPAVGEGYLPEPEESVLGSGRFVPGDLVRRTPQGFVLAGRVSDFINVAGRKLNPAEIEVRLREIPGVRDAMVFGVPSALRGEEPVACVAGDVSAAVLRRFCTANLAAWQAPRDFWIVDALPFDKRGKLGRRALAEIYRARACP